MSDKIMNTIERRERLIQVLNVRRHDKIGNLAFELGVSYQTLTRDIRCLSLFYPIYTMGGKTGGVFIVDGYKTGMRFLTEQQESELRKTVEQAAGHKREVLQSVLENFSLTEIKNRRR